MCFIFESLSKVEFSQTNFELFGLIQEFRVNLFKINLKNKTIIWSCLKVLHSTFIFKQTIMLFYFYNTGKPFLQ